MPRTSTIAHEIPGKRIRRCFRTLTSSTELLNAVGADEARGQFVKGLEVLAEALVTQLKPAKVPQPAERPLDDVAGLPQPAAVRLPGLAVGGQQGANPPPHHRRDDRFDPVGTVALEHVGSA